MKRDNPCYTCPDNGHGTGTGCGKHANCDRYMQFWKENQHYNEERHRTVAPLAVYTHDKFDKIKGGTRETMKKYRPKEG